MIEATLIFKDGIQTHLTFNVHFEDLPNEIDTKSKMGFIEFNEFSGRIPAYMHILGRMLKREAKKFWEEAEKSGKEVPEKEDEPRKERNEEKN
jgi:hypothetical protein